MAREGSSPVTEDVVDGTDGAPAGPLGRRFWTLVAASGASNLADGVMKVALPLLALAFTRSPSTIAALEIVRSAPWLLFSLPVGALADRWDRRRTMLLANTVRAGAVLVPAGFWSLGFDGLGLLFVVAGVSGVAEVFHDTAAQAILPAVVEREQLERANGRLFAMELASQQFVGAPLGGFLAGAVVVAALAAPGVLWLVAVALLLGVRGRFRAPGSEEGARSLRREVVEGLRFLRGHRLLRTMALMVGGLNLTTAAAQPLFLLYAVGEASALGLGEAGFGLLMVALAAGSVVGTLAADRVVARFGRARAMTAAVLAGAFFVGGPALTTSVPVVAAIFFVGGFCLVLWNVPTVSFRQAVTPDRLLARVHSAYRLVAFGAMPVGAALGGLLGETLGVRASLLVLGGLVLLLLVPDRVLTDERMDAARRDAAEASAPRSVRP